jgi:lipopolysaccharide assembly protein A
MRYVIWLLRAILFLILLGLAVKNDQPVSLYYFLGFKWETSLVVIMLLFFLAGAIVGMLAVFGSVLRQRREISALKRELRMKNKLIEAGEAASSPVQPS